MTFVPVTTVTIIPSTAGSRYIDLIHSTGDPCAWIVRISKKFLWFRRNSTRVWFSDEQQALRFAQSKAQQTA
jgi:hypothetical protein